MKKIGLVFTGVILMFALVAIFSLFEVVQPGNRGVMVTLGTVHQDVLGEGLHWKKPFIDSILQMDVKTKKIEVKSASSSKDLQMVTITLALNYNLLPSQVGVIYQTVGKEQAVQDTIIAPAIEEIVKAVTAQYTAEELITKRGEVSIAINEGLKGKLSKSHIAVTDVNIANFAFSAEFDKAIEAKVTAEQRAFEAQNKVAESEAIASQVKAQAEGEASRILQEAQAEAEGIREITNALNTEYVQYEMVKRWGGDVPQINGGGNSFLLDVGALLSN